MENCLVILRERECERWALGWRSYMKASESSAAIELITEGR